VCRLLSENAVVAHTAAILQNWAVVCHLEKQIVEHFVALFDNSSDERREALRAAVNQRAEELRKRDVELFAALTGHSIHLYYFCH
jgi:hypothetical protein